jgi:hypothetical protein
MSAVSHASVVSRLDLSLMMIGRSVFGSETTISASTIATSDPPVSTFDGPCRVTYTQLRSSTSRRSGARRARVRPRFRASVSIITLLS